MTHGSLCLGDNYETDKWLANIFAGWYDPCPLDPDPKIDGLLTDWKINTFVNPPYSNPKVWVRKAIMENRTYGATIVMLLKMDSSTVWFKELVEEGAHFLWINKRLKHCTTSAAAFPSMLAVLAGHDKKQKNLQEVFK